MWFVRQVTLGALAGACATMAMTAAMRRLHKALPPEELYPLPPREITERMLPVATRKVEGAAALLAHFGYGALTGAMYALLPSRRPPGIVYGPAIWAASYFGWIPAGGLLKPAHEHPGRRNALMLVAHAVWGAALTLCLNELQKASEQGFGRGPQRDAATDTDVRLR